MTFIRDIFYICIVNVQSQQNFIDMNNLKEREKLMKATKLQNKENEALDAELTETLKKLDEIDLKQTQELKQIVSQINRANDTLDLLVEKLTGDPVNYTVKEYAKLHHKSPRSILYLIKKGTIKAEKIGGTWSIPSNQSEPIGINNLT